jgi:hypothetical protein
MVWSMTRRTVLGGLAAAAAANLGRAAARSKIRLGGPVFGKHDDPRELARAHRALGYTAAYCPDAKLEDKERIRAIEEGFKAEGVVISEVGAWKNLLDPDGEKRKQNFDYVATRLALAEAVGSVCCVDIAGSYNPTVWYGPHSKNLSPEFFDATVENCRKLIDQVKPARTKFCIEMMGWAVPDSAESYIRLIHAVDRKAFGVHIDVCNVINSPATVLRQRPVHSRDRRQAGAVDSVVPRQGPGLASGDELAFRRGDPRARLGGLPCVPRSAGGAGARNAADAGTSQQGGGVRRGRGLHPQSGASRLASSSSERASSL